MGFLDDVRRAVPDDLKEKARDAASSAKAAAVDVGELAQSAADATAEVFDKGEQSFRRARADGQGLAGAAKEAGRGAMTPADGAAAAPPREHDVTA